MDPQQLKAFMLDKKLITEKDFKKAEIQARKENKSIEEILISKNLIQEEDLLKLKAYILGLQFIDLSKEKIDLKILNYIPESIARQYSVVAFKKENNNLYIAMLNPENLQILDFIRRRTHLNLIVYITNKQSIINLLKQYQESLEQEFGEIIRSETEEITKDILPTISEQATAGALELKDLEKIAKELPIVKIVDTLLKHAILRKASDIHIEPMEKEIVVRYRIDGILHDAMILPKKVHSGIVARIKVLSNLKLDEHRLPQDGRFKIETEEYKISFRVSIIPVYSGEKIVMRLLPEDSKGFTLETLGFHDEGLEIIHRNIRRPYGMILATGPTGCGKTTTLYTILDILNTPEVNICTIEDPIEYQIPRINQTQVNPKIGLTFANGLRSLLRQDPDIIMVGEIRDSETANLAINAALTGHLVLSTLHTNNAAGAVPRLIDMKVEPFLISSTLNVVIAQRLVRTLCVEKEKHNLTKAEIANLKKRFNMNKILQVMKREKIIDQSADWEDITFYRPKPSSECPDGYKGRIGIHEVFEVTPKIRDLIEKNPTIDAIQNEAEAEGMVTMIEDGFMKAVQGITSLEEVFRVTAE